jgi:hypothetical protein
MTFQVISQYEEFLLQMNSFIKTFPTTSLAFLKRLFPIVQWLPKYHPSWITHDMIAGLTCGIIVIPVVCFY